MSGSTQPSTDRFPVSGSAGTVAENAASRLSETVRDLAFWGAILLPVGYVLALHESVAGQRVELFLLLVVFHVACILIGHGRARSGSP